MAVVRAVQGLLAGEEVSVDSARLTVHRARLDAPRPVQDRIPLTVGTSNSRLLRFAGEHADVVGLSGLGRTLADGHMHAVRWTTEVVDRQVALVAEGGGGPEPAAGAGGARPAGPRDRRRRGGRAPRSRSTPASR
ncbi:LLM class flavin-dependent oxidoreductase [Georgenia sp. SUBG003]|uniref:LLM class flavin-dependent oxidoreductase n=1 Tax=Georgenia sp. SUBG003 TaxID=1497974 RepID=UPI003AB8862B